MLPEDRAEKILGIVDPVLGQIMQVLAEEIYQGVKQPSKEVVAR